MRSTGKRAGLPTIIAGLALLAGLVLAPPAAQAKKGPNITVFIGYVLDGTTTSVDKAVLSFTCVPEDEHRHQRGRGHEEHGRGHGFGHGGPCPSKITVLVTLQDVNGTTLGSACVAGISLSGTPASGSATFDFQPDVPISPIATVTVALVEVCPAQALSGPGRGGPVTAPLALFIFPPPRPR